MNNRIRGFTLVEALSTLMVFGVFMTVLFLTIGWGFRSFSLAIAKSDVTTEARRIALFLERDLQSSNFFSVSVVSRSDSDDSAGIFRDAVCFASRSSWAYSPTSIPYNPAKGLPNWNRYFVYYATQDPRFGKLIRMSLAPTGTSIGGFPYTRFYKKEDQKKILLEDPLGAYPAEVDNVRTLASSVKTFKVTTHAATEEVEIHILLRQNGLMAYRANKDREGGTFELKYLVKPENTK